MRIHTLRRAHGLALALTSVGVGACADAPTAATAATAVPSLAAQAGPARLAATGYTGIHPSLWLRDLDGGAGLAADTVRFVGVVNRVPDNEPRLLPVTDATLNRLGPARWSPDGSELAVVGGVAFDQSEVLIMRADGHHVRVASVDRQIIMSGVDWSPDGGRLAYTMSTLPFARGVDLFVTDLRTMAVRRLTTGLALGISALRFDAKGGVVFFTQRTGEQPRAPFNPINRVRLVRLETGEGEVVAEDVVGDVQGLARDGTWALVTREAIAEDGSPTRELVVRYLDARRGEVVLARDPGLRTADLVEGDREAVVASASGGPYGDTDRWTLVPLGGGAATPIRGVPAGVTTLAVKR